MKRITPEEVKAAYEATGLSPNRGCWYDDGCGCGLTAYAIANGIVSLADIQAVPDDQDNEYAVCDPLVAVLGTIYVSGFVDGFDNSRIRPRVSSRDDISAYECGFTDGQSAAALIFGEAAQ